jgi:hypothetical protein
MVVGDFNGDGIPDLIVAASAGPTGPAGVVTVLLGNGDGTFQSAGNFPAGNGVNSLSVGDFNGDGKLDIVTTNFDFVSIGPQNNLIIESDVHVFLGNGDGTFRAARTYTAGVGPVSAGVGDFNGDGIADLAVVNGGLPGTMAGNTVSILLGNGDGTFQPALDYPAGIWPRSVAVGDFNRDGNQDLAVTGQSGVTILLGDGKGAFQPPHNYAAGLAGSVAVADFNGDGYPDLVVAEIPGSFVRPGSVSIILNAAD